MSVLAEYQEARRGEDVARLRRVIALRAMVASGMSQRQIAEELAISQPAVSQQLKFAPDLDDVHPQALLEAAAPVLKALAEVTALAGAALAPLPPGSPMRMPPAPRSVRAQRSMRLLMQPARNQIPYSPVWATSQARKVMPWAPSAMIAASVRVAACMGSN